MSADMANLRLNPYHPGEPRHRAPEDLVLYAMQLLSTERVASTVVHLHACDHCRDELSRIYSDIALYASTVELEVPAASARERLIEQVAREKRVIPSGRQQSPTQPHRPITQPRDLAEVDRGTSVLTTEPQPRKPSRRRGFVFWGGWTVAAVLAAAVTFLLGDRLALREAIDAQNGRLERLTVDAALSHQLLDALTDPRAVRVTLSRPAQARSGPLGEITYDAEQGTLVFLASELYPLQPHKTYELWLVPMTGGPVPAGTFHPDDHGNASVVLPDLPKGIFAKAFAVTIENEGGSQKPTLPITIVGS